MEAKVADIEKEAKEDMQKNWREVENEIKQFMTRLHREVREDKQQIINEVTEQVMQEISEREEHQRRLKKLVIYGVKVSENINGKEREKDDAEYCRKLFEELNVNNARMEGMIKLGKRNQTRDNQGVGKPRPMLVKLDDAGTKFNILK